MHRLFPRLTTSVKQHPVLLYALLFFAAFALRAASFGTPFFSSDEEFYLFVGGRILSGDLPFVDVWDRKPIGIFLLYTVFHLFGEWRFWAYQIGATLSAALTAIFIMRSARIIAPLGGAFIAGLLYLGWINVAHGGGGQTPIFYNALIAYALYLMMSNIDSFDKKTINTVGIKVMALFGIAIQIKYTVVFEGIFAGLYLIYALYRHTGRISDLAKSIPLWVGTALLPTLIVFLFYVSLGYGHQWWFANVESIFLREKIEARPNEIYMASISAFLITPLVLHIIFERKRDKKEYFILLWSLSSWFGVFIVGDYFKHYVLPLFVPFFIAFAPLWTSRIGKIYLSLSTLIGFITGEKIIYHSSHKERAEVMYDIHHIIIQNPGCSFEYNGPSSLQDVRPYCHITPFLFPGHLNATHERNAIGVNQTFELKRVFSQNPLYIIDTISHNSDPDITVQNTELFKEEISQKYTPVYISKPYKKEDQIILYRLKKP
ncbi:ArnT family glycosyltransferase [Saccharibacter floricola]|uniref:Glycosyltransferase RgtA/B/C/D-like domain-containing protein n=1 Tax=Saccharibacter floricola DSM 15669 TaxID=1123227 RepID=A0ABQ0NZT8_9PROT|nr:glycosyltransferase family 39 protein [Saccharibacter floricola]GBQ07432.1 hypothetical protein AA15669_1379 [Saccharibacter floricola DSM 15669]